MIKKGRLYRMTEKELMETRHQAERLAEQYYRLAGDALGTSAQIWSELERRRLRKRKLEVVK